MMQMRILCESHFSLKKKRLNEEKDFVTSQKEKDSGHQKILLV